ncbi:MAG: protein translocase subunit SecF [Candidatus Woesearchaeota archaeon]
MVKMHNPKKNKHKLFGKKPETKQADFKEKGGSFYYKYYKQLLIIPMLMLLIAFVLIGFKVATTGEFINKGISLKGGTSFTITQDLADIQSISLSDLKNSLLNEYPQADIEVRELQEFGVRKAVLIDVDISEQQELELFQTSIVSNFNDLTKEELAGNMQMTGSALGNTFFKQILKALILAFIFMAIVVFIQFRVAVPSLAVILCAFSDIVVTIAIINLMGVKLSTAGIAAFLMLIGYSVDTDILMSTRVLKEKTGTVYERIISSLKTGMLMNLTTLAAVSVALFLTQSEVIRQIMLILFIGLIVDMINTWIQNAGILRYYAEKEESK